MNFPRRKSYILFVIFLIILTAWLIKWQLRSDISDEEIPFGLNSATSSLIPTTTSSIEKDSFGRLVIPDLKIDAKIEMVGINAKGNMAVPSNYKNVAWYRLGPKPGEKGNAVMAGHLDNSLGLPGVFLRLDELKVGDEIKVVQKDRTFSFRVVDKKVYPYNNAPLKEIFGPSDKARLNLITCGGDWIRSLKTYEERVVVFTELIS